METVLKILLVVAGAWTAVAACLGLMLGRWMSLQKYVSDRDGLTGQVR